MYLCSLIGFPCISVIIVLSIFKYLTVGYKFKLQLPLAFFILFRIFDSLTYQTMKIISYENALQIQQMSLKKSNFDGRNMLAYHFKKLQNFNLKVKCSRHNDTLYMVRFHEFYGTLD